jgi:hypothetical protein
VRDYLPAGEEAWVPLTDGQHYDDKPALSPNGKILYFTSTRDGYPCIWDERLDPGTKYPVGAPAAIQHLHSERQFPLGSDPLSEMQLFVAKDILITSPTDLRTDIWMMDLKNRR